MCSLLRGRLLPGESIVFRLPNWIDARTKSGDGSVRLSLNSAYGWYLGPRRRIYERSKREDWRPAAARLVGANVVGLSLLALTGVGFRAVPSHRDFDWRFDVADFGRQPASAGRLDLKPNHEALWRPDGAPPMTYDYRADSVEILSEL